VLVVKPAGNKGPEVIKPLESEVATIAGMAVAAACRNDWARARDLLYRLSLDDLETVGSVVNRFPVKAAREVRFARRTIRQGDWSSYRWDGRDRSVGVSIDELLGDVDGPYCPSEP
jgi:hypothetical protein